MSHYYVIGLHGLHGVHCVDERLPLYHARGRHRHVYQVGREALGRKLEAYPRPSRRFVEQGAYGLAPEDRHGLDRTREKVLEITRGLADKGYFLGGEGLHIEEVFSLEPVHLKTIAYRSIEDAVNVNN